MRRGRLWWTANPSLALPPGGRERDAVFEEGGGGAAGGFGVVGGFEDVAQAGDGLDLGVGEHVAGAEFEQGGDA